MERDSPIKLWMQRHSPIKSRNKPLPRPPPATTSPTKRPISQISGNAGTSAGEQHSKPKRRLASFFRAGDKPNNTEEGWPTKGHHRFGSAPVNDCSHPPPSPNLNSLSAKVNSLEEQLRDARQQLNAYASGSHRTRQPKPHTIREVQQSADTIYSALGSRQPNALQDLRLEGVMENLMHQHSSQHQQGRRKRELEHRASRSASADMGEAFERYRRALDAYEDARSECDQFYASADEGQIDGSARQKRRRSEVRSSSWQAVQEYAARESKSRHKSQGDQRAGDNMLASRRVVSDEQAAISPKKAYHKKSLPRCPPKTPSPTPKKKDSSFQSSRHRRSNSKAENELSMKEIQALSGNHRAVDSNCPPLSPSKRYASSPSKLLPVEEEFEWDDEVF